MRFGLVLTIVHFLCVAAFAAEVPQKLNIAEQVRFSVEKFELKNGLTVLVHEDHSAPILSYHQWYRVGSRNERVGRTGLAHFFEHLMFKGTKKFASGQFERLMQGNGGTNNAFTTRDYTGYYSNLPSDKLALIAEVEADRMQNLLLDPNEVQSEREVVKEERRMRVENSIFGTLFESLFRTVYKVNNYRWPVIGSMRDLNAASMDDLKNFYKTYYSPNNAVIVVVGAVDTAEVKKVITKHYAKIPRAEVPPVKSAPEPEQKAARSKVIRKAAQSASFAIAYKGPEAGVDDAYALDLLANILGSGSSSRLHRRLVYRQQRATSISAWAYTTKEPGIFAITSTLKPGMGVGKTIKVVEEELKRIRNEDVDKLELEKAKNQVMLGYVNSLRTVAGKAQALALNEIYFGNYEEMFKDMDRYAAVTEADIRRVANKYLSEKRRSIVRVLPKKKSS